MESVLMNKFEIIDMPGMNTMAFVVEEMICSGCAIEF